MFPNGGNKVSKKIHNNHLITSIVKQIVGIRDAGNSLPQYSDAEEYVMPSEYSGFDFYNDLSNYTKIRSIVDVKGVAKFIYQFYPELNLDCFTPLFFSGDTIVYRNYITGTTESVDIYKSAYYTNAPNIGNIMISGDYSIDEFNIRNRGVDFDEIADTIIYSPKTRSFYYGVKVSMYIASAAGLAFTFYKVFFSEGKKGDKGDKGESNGGFLDGFVLNIFNLPLPYFRK